METTAIGGGVFIDEDIDAVIGMMETLILSLAVVFSAMETLILSLAVAFAMMKTQKL